MKKKLLITLGCSFTEGVGCYDPELVSRYATLNDYTKNEIKNKSIERFHENGWPPRLQKKLNYDKLINLGKEGTGESFHLKRFIEEFSDVDLAKNYEVLIVWLTSPPGRISFYSNGILRSILSNWSYDYEEIPRNISQAYAKLIENVELDPILEQVFYIKTLKEICDGKGYTLLVFPTGSTKLYVRSPRGKLNNLLTIPENMSLYYFDHESTDKYYDILPLGIPEYESIMKCIHPNEKGYELIAQRMMNIIQIYNPKLINSTIPTVFEKEWRAPKQW